MLSFIEISKISLFLQQNSNGNTIIELIHTVTGGIQVVPPLEITLGVVTQRNCSAVYMGNPAEQNEVTRLWLFWVWPTIRRFLKKMYVVTVTVTYQWSETESPPYSLLLVMILCDYTVCESHKSFPQLCYNNQLCRAVTFLLQCSNHPLPIVEWNSFLFCSFSSILVSSLWFSSSLWYIVWMSRAFVTSFGW